MNEPFSFSELEKISKLNIKKPNFLFSTDGVNLAYYSFIPKKNISAVIIFYHGAGLYSNASYQSIGLTLQKESDIASYFFDIRGHGHSGGPRGDASAIERVWQDLDEVINFVYEQHPNIKIYLVGHSSGCGLILNYDVYKKNNKIEGYIFLAPYLGPLSGTIRPEVGNKSFVKKVRTWLYLINNIFKIKFLQRLHIIFFNYPSWLLERDPLIVAQYTYIMSCAITPYDIDKIFAQLDKPFALFIGDRDEQFLPESVLNYKNKATKVKNKSIGHIVKNAKHLSILLEAPALIIRVINAQN